MGSTNEHPRDPMKKIKKEVVEYINYKVALLRAKGISIKNAEIDMYVSKFSDSQDDIEVIKREIDTLFDDIDDKKNIVYQNNNGVIPDDNRASIGCNINLQLVDFANIYEVINSNSDLTDEEKEKLFIKMRDEYLGKHETTYNGISTLSYKEMQNFMLEIKNNFSSITPEMEFSLSNVLAHDGDIFDQDGFINDNIFNFDGADKIYKFAVANNLEVDAHLNLTDEGIPDYLKDELYSVFEKNPSKARKMLSSLLVNYFKSLGNKYKIEEWEVLSNILTTEANIDNRILNDSIFKDILGDSYYIEILKLARENLPAGARIVYTEGDEDSYKKRQGIIEIINEIKNYETRNDIKLLDVIGLEGHYNDRISDSQIEEIFRDITILGKDIKFTELNVLKTKQTPLEQNRVYNAVLHFASLYGISDINLYSFDDNLAGDVFINSAVFDKKGHPKDVYDSFVELIGHNRSNTNNNRTTANMISLMGKAVGAYMTYSLITLLNRLQDDDLPHSDKIQALEDYKKQIILNANKLNLHDVDLSSLSYEEILRLIENINSNITALTIDSNDLFDKSINPKAGDISDNFDVNSEFSSFARNADINVEVDNLFGNNFCYPSNLDTYFENIYTKEDRLLTQKEKNDILVDLVRKYLDSIAGKVNSNNLRLDSVVVLNNILDEYGSTRWWEENFGDDYYVTLFQIVNDELTDSVALSWNEDDIINDDDRRNEFFDRIERIVQHDPFLISVISTDIIIDDGFNIEKFDETVREINYFCKRMKEEYGADIKFKFSDFSFRNVDLFNSKFDDIRHILATVATNYFIGLNISNILIFNSFSFLNGLQNKTLQSYSHETRNIYDILSSSIAYDISGSILEKDIIRIFQKNHDRTLKGILACNSNFPETFVENSNISSRSQDFFQIGSGAKHVARVTERITSNFPKMLSVVEEATQLGCVDSFDYLTTLPTLYESRVVRGESNVMCTKPIEKNKVLTKMKLPNNVGFSSYLSLTFIIFIFMLVFILCILYYV